MEEIKNEEKKYKKAKTKISFMSLIITIIILILVALILGISNINNNSYDPNNAYKVTGEILTISEVYKDIILQIEDKEEGMFAVVLKDNKLISSILLNNLEFKDINDFSVVLEDYDNDRNKDFIYISDKADKGYNYNFYTIDKKGNIEAIDKEPINLDIKKASVKLTKVKDDYKYIAPVFYYSDYKVNAEVGKYKLEEKVNINKNLISKTSKIALDGNFNAFPRKVEKLDEFPEYIQNANSYLLDIENKECIEVDLDGDKANEYMIYILDNNKVNISLYDNSANFLVNLISKEGKATLEELVEIADIDGDNVMELVVIDGNNIEVHRYNNGFYY